MVDTMGIDGVNDTCELPCDDIYTNSGGRFKKTFLAEDNPGGILVTSGELR